MRLRESKFRGNSSYKLSPASVSHEFVFREWTHASNSPSQIISSLTEISRVASPPFSALSILALRASNFSAFFYPPQILCTLDLFAKLSYSSVDLFSFIASRKDDLLNEPSPKRLVALVRAMGALNLPMFHPELWPQLRAELARVLPQFRRGVPQLINSLGRQDCGDEELIEALVAQSVCLLDEVGVEIVAKTFLEAAKLGFGKERLVDFLKIHHKFGPLASKNLAAALKWHNLEHDRFVSQKNGFENCEEILKNADFCRKILPSIISTVENEDLRELVIANQLAHASVLSAEKLLCYVRAARNKTEWLRLLRPLARQLTVREARLLWEHAPDMVPVHALPPLMRPNSAAVHRTVGPYMLERTSDNQYELLLPHHAIFQPCRVMRPDILLRQAALQKHVDEQVTIRPLRTR